MYSLTHYDLQLKASLTLQNEPKTISSTIMPTGSNSSSTTIFSSATTMMGGSIILFPILC